MTTNSKLVFIDIDGTLADENHVVPESAKIACKQAQANGHKLFICTGRSVPKIEIRGCGHFLGDNHAAIPWL